MTLTKPCKEWPRARTKAGYGVKRFRDKLVYIHRKTWEDANGPIPVGINILHRCDNPPCYELEHLFPGTRKRNSEDCVAKDRQGRGERNGHAKLTDEQILSIRADTRTQRAIAADYHVSHPMVNKIKKRRNWRHI